MLAFFHRSALAAALLTSAVVPVSAGPAAQVTNYIAAWVSPSKADFKQIFAAEGNYFDADWNRSVEGDDFESYRKGFPGLRFSLLGQSIVEQEVVLNWAVSDGQQQWTCSDTLTLTLDGITAVVSTGGGASAADTAWADRFIAARRSLEAKEFRPFMDSKARVVGTSLIPGGYTVDGFIDFMKTIRGTVYERLPESQIYRGKDGHFYYEFHVLLASGTPVVSGRDHLVRKDGLITLFEGVY